MKNKNPGRINDDYIQAFIAAALGFSEMAIEEPGSETLIQKT